VQQDNAYTKIFIKDRWDTTVEGIATYLDANKAFTVIYTLKGLLYILSTESGRRVEIPLKTDSLSKIFLNDESYLLLLDSAAKLKVDTLLKKIINLALKKVTHKSDIRSLLINHYIGNKQKKIDSADWFKDYSNDFDVFVSPKGHPIVKLDISTYLIYNTDYECWSQANESSVCLSFDLHSKESADSSKPIFRNLAFEQHTESLLSSIAQQGEMGQYLASKEEGQSISNIIAKTEEDMLYCIETKDKLRYNECLKNYIIELANHKQLEKLKYFLIVTLLSDTNSKERNFLTSIGVKPDIIVANALKILEKIDYCSGLVDELRQVSELGKLDRT
jgi:hypothetical protein